MSRVNSRNVVYIKYTSGNGWRQTLFFIIDFKIKIKFAKHCLVYINPILSSKEFLLVIINVYIKWWGISNSPLCVHFVEGNHKLSWFITLRDYSTCLQN